MKNEIKEKLKKLILGFQSVIYEKDESFLEDMKSKNLAGDDVRHYMYWEWTQGVGLYGLYRLYEKTGDEDCRAFLVEYYEKCFEIGLPAKNINTYAPLLTLALLNRELKNPVYDATLDEWAEALIKKMPRTQEGGFQHITSDSINTEELWDDTLFMAVLFLTIMGELRNNDDYRSCALYQVLLHHKYLADKVSGLCYHGWSFLREDNFAAAFWGRGNCWVTAFIPEFLRYTGVNGGVRKYLVGILKQQIDSLVRYQAPSGLWHTLIDDETSYEEVSATCGFGFGILSACHSGLLNDKYKEVALKALPAVLKNITEEGVVTQVSYGTPMGRAGKDFYKAIPIRSMPYGTALAILFLMEAIDEV